MKPPGKCQDASWWEEYFLELDAFGRFFLSNLPRDYLSFSVASNEWPKLRRALYQMTETSFFEFCWDVREEMLRRENDLRDGLFFLPPRKNASLGRNHIRKKLSTFSSRRFDSLCLHICREIGRRSSALTRKKQLVKDLKVTQGLAAHRGDQRHYTIEREEVEDLSSLLGNFGINDYLSSSGFDTLLLVHPYHDFDAMLSTIYSVVISILQDKFRYTALLSYQGDAAQLVLDLLQMLLDYPNATLIIKNALLNALLLLSVKSGLYPRCFALTGINLEEELVKSGSFGDIWKGRFDGQAVCLKVVKIYQNSRRERLQVFHKEAIVWGHVFHLNLLPFYGVYHLDDQYRRMCLVSPWMDHGNLVEHLKKYPATRRLPLVSDVVAGLSYLHEKDIVHGDLKGANILVTDTGTACLCDFGLSSIAGNAMSTYAPFETGSDNICGGTVRWQAPELLDPCIDDPRKSPETDVYAFGCVCYEIYTGKVPFYEFTLDATVILQIMLGARPSTPIPEDPAFVERGLTNEIWRLVEDCWAQNPTERPCVAQIVARLPRRDGPDPWSVRWLEVSRASRFRNAVYRQDCLSMGVLETILAWI
ncbi:unnamed protein product [Cyclocybe aegerita]|uniref:Protein kinase domain-containing protein n=1 Tax=Cyclocybe aegerita TaxID=1973307 RepID=A0A8S0VZG9_CYCAE|nr:unnamed protein product [Cyclocybe aegerita]